MIKILWFALKQWYDRTKREFEDSQLQAVQQTFQTRVQKRNQSVDKMRGLQVEAAFLDEASNVPDEVQRLYSSRLQREKTKDWRKRVFGEFDRHTGRNDNEAAKKEEDKDADFDRDC